MNDQTNDRKAGGGVESFRALLPFLGLLCGLLLPSAFGAEKQPPTPDPPATPVLREARQLLNSSPEQLKKGAPAQLEVVVTHVHAGYGMLFGQDDTAGIYLHHLGKLPELKPGDLLQVKGAVRQGLFNPFLDVQELRVAGQRPLPPARPVTMEQVLSGSMDSQFVEVQGVVRRESLSGGRLKLELAAGSSRLSAYVLNPTNHEPLRLTDSLVRVRGVAASQTDRSRQITGFTLQVNGSSDITLVEAPAQDAAASRPRLAKDLRTYPARTGSIHRVRAQGLVTLFWPGRVLFIQDPSGAIQVQSKFEGDLQPGDVADVVGFLSPQLDSLRLEDSVVQKIASADAPRPVRISAEEAFSGRLENSLVELEAKLLHRSHPEPDLTVLMLESGSRLITAALPTRSPVAAASFPEDGSQVLLTGVCQRESLAGGTRSGLHLWLRSPADVRLLSRGDRHRVQWVLMVLSLAAIGLLVAVLAAHWRQRRRTERILREQSALQVDIRESQEQLHRSMQERERIGQDLHDDIIQSIYSVGLGLEDARRLLRQSPDQVEARLAVAINALNETIRSVRSFIAGLEPKVLNGREFKTALKSLALTAAENQSQFSIEVDPTAANRLTSNEATQLLHVAKEALSNSLRHAHAARISVSLKPASQGVRLEICDDGVGFDPASAGLSGQGLRNMASRASSLGAELESVSTPGSGCRIVVTVPKHKADAPN